MSLPWRAIDWSEDGGGEGADRRGTAPPVARIPREPPRAIRPIINTYGTMKASSTSAERMRLHRKRRRAGLRYPRIMVDETEIDGLIRKGLLKQHQRHDLNAIRGAVYDLLFQAAEGVV